MGRFWRTAPGGGREALVLKDTVSGLYGRCTLCVVDTEDRIMMGAVKRRGCAGRTVMERRVSLTLGMEGKGGLLRKSGSYKAAQFALLIHCIGDIWLFWLPLPAA